MSRFLQSSNEPTKSDWFNALLYGLQGTIAFSEIFEKKAQMEGTSPGEVAIEFVEHLWEDLSLGLDSPSDEKLASWLSDSLNLDDLLKSSPPETF